MDELLNVTAYMQGFVDKIKRKQSSFSILKQNDMQKAEKLWIKYVQQKKLYDQRRIHYKRTLK